MLPFGRGDIPFFSAKIKGCEFCLMGVHERKSSIMEQQTSNALHADFGFALIASQNYSQRQMEIIYGDWDEVRPTYAEVDKIIDKTFKINDARTQMLILESGRHIPE
jgi:hypothetical protein